MKSALRTLLLLIVIATIAGCGYTAYLGMHRKSIQ
jgi:predicted small lipoprotein YifL